ncbi:MAG: LuxR C-terminal-related transcriptional regulator [Chloroflexi bacterium]|nr:LuxR C-terminal-related transcriptional regulator [Chloroflexota bacterium]MDA1241441.1 LuxR C-terminal-related transcriptional regulator [Chloroflexota bacterium]
MPEIDPVELVRQAIRDLSPGEEWRTPYQAAVRAAHAASDLTTAARLTAVAAACHIAAGQYREALAEVDFGLRLSPDVPAVRAELLRARAGLEIFGIDPEQALRTLAEAAAADPEPSEAARLEALVLRRIAECVVLDDRAPGALAEALHVVERAGRATLAAEAIPRLVPALVAFGNLDAGRPWVETMGAQAEVLRSRWRRLEARALEEALFAPRGRIHQAIEWPEHPMGFDFFAAWMAAGIGSYQSVVTGGRRPRPLSGLVNRLHAVLPPGFRLGTDGFQAVVATHLDGRIAPEAEPPERVTLFTASSTLAMAEAVALGGSQRQAATWARWFDEAWPGRVVTTLAWPVVVLRVRALLQARSGDIGGAVRHLRAAVRWADGHGYTVEAALGRVQLAEMLALTPSTTARREWEDTRRAGRLGARAVGVDAAAAAHAAIEAVALGRFDNVRPALTPREAEVLHLLAEGRSYRTAADALGLEWRTVQVHARNIYQKLGVHSKVEAVLAAREAGLI